MKVLGFGAIVWDSIPVGLPRQGQTPEKTSEAQNPNLGGAVLNVMAHLQRLGNRTAIISSLGQDKLGEQAVESIEQMGIEGRWIGRVAQPTPLVRVEFDNTGEPSYIIDDDISCDNIAIKESDIALISDEKFATFCFGTFEQRMPCSRNALKTLLEKVSFEQVFLDVNLRAPFYSRETIAYSLEQCTIAKLNVDEAEVLGKMFGLDTTDIERLTKQLRERFEIEQVCVTAGGRGVYYSSPEAFGFCRGYKVTVADTVGAGDAFSAGLLHGMQSGSLEAACDLGCRMGALVASKTSAIPDYDLVELETLIRNSD
ncbi:MAG: carbohydrate kinase [Sedimentisphaerales bacterium]|nr:carbohydrate kinase [Sedimentisphaerales bacterium]